MKQIWITRSGPPEALEIREAPDPEPKPGEARIRVEASGVNFADVMGRLGVYPDLPKLPVVPGYEIAGRIDAVGAGADPAWIGRDVLAMTRFGGYSDVVCLPLEQVFVRPAGMSADIGAALPVNYLTAWQLVVVMGALKPGEKILIHSAGGGVGVAATQIARHIGAVVIGVASAWKHAELKSLGVDHLIDGAKEDIESRVLEITAGRGVELVLDPVGGESFKQSYRLLAPTGRLGMFGASALASSKSRNLADVIRMIATMPWFTFTPPALINANKGVFGVNLLKTADDFNLLKSWMDDLLDLWAQGVVQPKIAKTFLFEEAPLAHHYLQDRKNLGKILLKPRSLSLPA